MSYQRRASVPKQHASGKSSASATSKRREHNARQKRSARAVGLTEFSQSKGHVRALEEFKKRKQRKQLETSVALRNYRKLMKREGMEAGTGASRKRREETIVGHDNDSDHDHDHDYDDDDGNDNDHDNNDSKELQNTMTRRKRPRAHDSGGGDSDSGGDSEADDGSRSSDRDSVTDDDNNNNNDDDSVAASSQKQSKPPRRPTKSDPFRKARQKAVAAKEQAAERARQKEANEKDRERKLRFRKKQTKLLRQRTSKGQPIMKHAVNNLLHKLEQQQQQQQQQRLNEQSQTSHGQQRQQQRKQQKQKQKQPIRSKKRGPDQTNRPLRPQQSDADPPKKKKKARKFY